MLSKIISRKRYKKNTPKEEVGWIFVGFDYGM
jgi:hypothetical protein